MPNVTLATVFNRKHHTLTSLKTLIESCDPAGVDATHCTVDDNSNDGTSEAIRKQFPQVIILHGNGHLYWAGGMRYGFDFINENYSYDFLIPYNDDGVFNQTSIQTLLKGFYSLPGKVGIVVGSLADPSTKRVSYGGKILRWRLDGFLRHSFWLNLLI